MPDRYEAPAAAVSARRTGWRLGLVVHPTRDVGEPLAALRQWTEKHGVQLVQVPVPVAQRKVADSGDAGDCDLIASIGGDGTTLAAIRVAAAADRPVLGIACGSLGVLTTIDPPSVPAALERFDRDDWFPLRLPALEAEREGGERVRAFNDIAIVRSGEGQVRVDARLDGTLYARFAGDGCIVSTPLGTSGYALAAGGPLLAPSVDGFMLTPLSTHGGFTPPLVMSARSTLELEPTSGHGGARLELDGQVADQRVDPLRISLREAAATVVRFADQEPMLTRLRRRHIIVDGPRALVEERRQR